MWNTTNETQANAEGWRLVTTFLLGDTHPLWDIAKFGIRYKTDQAATMAVIDAAKRGSTFHQHALRLVTTSRGKPPKNK